MSTPPDSNPVRTGIISTVVGAILVAALTEIWPPLKSVLWWCWSQLVAFFGVFTTSYLLPGWLVVVLGVLSLVTIFRLVAALFAKDDQEKPKIFSYTTDTFHRARWRWQWSADEISNLWCFCPSCDSELVFDDSSCQNMRFSLDPRTDFICEHCSHSLVASIKGGDKSYALSAVQREIRRKLRTGEAPPCIKTTPNSTKTG